MVRPEYMRLKVSDIPGHIIHLYKLDKLTTTDGYVYVLIQKGMHGPPQAGIIAQKLLEDCLATKGYQQSTITPGFWKHDWCPISCILCIDDFGVKYIGIKHHITYFRPLTNTTKLHRTGKVSTNFVSLSHGIMHNNKFISPCQATVKKLVNVSTTPIQLNNNINLTPIRPAPKAPNNNLPIQKTTPLYPTKLLRPLSKRS
jgi:hypothetical protein